jgi:hypothetical protein
LPEASAGRTDEGQAAGQVARGYQVRLRSIWGLLLPCVMYAGQVVVDLNSDGPENSCVSSQSSVGRFVISVPPLSRVTGVALTFGGQTSADTLPCCSTTVAGGGISQTDPAYRERESGGLVFVECSVGPSESRPGGRQSASDRPARLEVSYEPLSRAERAPRERLLGGCAVADSSARIFSNPADTRAWYSPPETSLCPLFGGDPVPYDFEFAELANVQLKSHVVIMAHIGGWGNVPMEETDDIIPTIEGVKKHLRSRGISSVVVPHYRAQGGLLGKLLTVSELFELHHSDADRLCREVERFLWRHPQQRLVMVGLSNGAAFADEVMERLPDTVLNRVCAIEVGAPFLNPSDAGESVLRLDNHGEDPVAAGDYWVLLRVRMGVLVKGVYTWLTGREHPRTGAFVAEHEYSWPSVREEVAGFLDRWLGR